MNDDRQQNERFEPHSPLAPIGMDGDQGEPQPIPPDALLADGPRENDPLTALIDRATRPPADLKLDWGRLHANLAREPMPRPAAASTPVQPPRPWRIRLTWAGGLAAAAVLMLTAALWLHHGLGPTGNPPNGGQVVQTPPASPRNGGPGAPAEGPTVAVGVTPEAARQMVSRQPQQIVVVFPRRPGEAALVEPASAGGAGEPLTLTDKVPLSGTPYGRQLADSDNGEAVYLSN